jgi:radical SAM superfamily enzyme YgiQ (UPF0313 family)
VKILLVYPEVADTFWSFKHALKVAKRKAAFPPLGALTVASILPSHWEKRLVDMNVRPLTEDEIAWADYVFISAMIAQKESTEEVVKWCRRKGKKTVGGGPLFFGYREEFEDVDYLVIGEGEAVIPRFCRDLERGVAERVYETNEHPELTGTPVPMWDLIDFRDYSTLSVQYSRGCPFNCEFCDIIIMNGRVTRSKSNEQMIEELEALWTRGWRGTVFIVDDNFIGNKGKVKSLLRAIIDWQNRAGRRFNYFTEASVNLAEDPELMSLMAEAGFNKVFLGLETPCEESLKECGKSQNLKQRLEDSVRIIHENGMAVMGGFIIGFDHDPPDIFQRQVEFVQKNGVVMAMVGLLTALPGTRLYKRLEQEGRLLFKSSGNNSDVAGALNFVPKMDRETLINGYNWVMNTIYSPDMYYNRIQTFLKIYRPNKTTFRNREDYLAFVRSFWFLGMADEGPSRKEYWNMLKKGFTKYRESFGDSVSLAIHGYHFRKLFWSPEENTNRS